MSKWIDFIPSKINDNAALTAELASFSQIFSERHLVSASLSNWCIAS